MRKTMISVLLCLSASFIYPSCEKSSMDKMQLLYSESMGLKDVDIDSIRSFSSKVNDYVTVNPSERQNPLYPKIQNNIKSAALSITIEIDTIWDNTIDYRF